MNVLMYVPIAEKISPDNMIGNVTWNSTIPPKNSNVQDSLLTVVHGAVTRNSPEKMLYPATSNLNKYIPSPLVFEEQANIRDDSVLKRY